MKRPILVSLLIIMTFSLFAQDSTRSRRISKEQKKEERHQRINAMIKQEEEGALIYSKQSVFGIQLRTNGYGIFYEIGKLKTRRKTTIYGAELTEIKDAKEEKTPPNGFFSFNNPYVFGKINNFYQLKLGFGQQYLIGQKGNKNGVAVTAVYHGGLSLGLLRPYYLDVNDSAGDRQIKYSVKDSALFLDVSKIRGSAGIGKGWGEIKMRPGLYAKGAIRFDYGRYNEIVSGIEIGISIDVYSEKIPILLYAKQRQVFFQGHIAFLFGKRK